MRLGRRLGGWLDAALERRGLRIVQEAPEDDDHAATIAKVRANTMTSPARLRAMCDAAEYVARHKVPGAVVECGVWKGGSMMAAAHTLLAHGDGGRDLYLFDTFEGMSEPGPEDRDHRGVHAAEHLARGRRSDDIWAHGPLADVQAGMRSTGYDAARVHYVRGKVEDTLPAQAPASIALLRLDTDWYGSTRHELEHLYPRLVRGGVLIIDDYGHWQGARKAADEYLAKHGLRLLLGRIDHTGRMAVKVDE